MLLNEMQKQQVQTTEKISAQAARIALLEQQLAEVRATLATMQTTNKFVAQR
jgi:hypothetical protein